MKIIVAGDRRWEDDEMVNQVLDDLLEELDESEDLCIIEGGSKGADRAAGWWAGFRADMDSNVAWKQIPADWSKGKSAGPIRNRAMLDEMPNRVLVFHDNLAESKGTKDLIQEALRRGIPVTVHSHLHQMGNELLDVEDFFRLVDAQQEARHFFGWDKPSLERDVMSVRAALDDAQRRALELAITATEPYDVHVETSQDPDGWYVRKETWKWRGAQFSSTVRSRFEFIEPDAEVIPDRETGDEEAKPKRRRRRTRHPKAMEGISRVIKPSPPMTLTSASPAESPEPVPEPSGVGTAS